MTSFEDIYSVVELFHSESITAEQLESYFQNLNTDDCNKWTIHNSHFTEFLSTWRVKRQDIVAESVLQEDDLDTCWAIALSIGQNALVKLKLSPQALLTVAMLLDGVPVQYQSSTFAVDRLEDLNSFMVAGNYVKQMIVHHRPRELDEDVQEKFERLIEDLLAQGPVVVAIDVFPSYNGFSGQGIFSPTELDCQRREYERFPRHCVVLYGKGVEVHGSRMHEFWEALETLGKLFGDNGFVRFARHQYVIREVVELRV